MCTVHSDTNLIKNKKTYIKSKICQKFIKIVHNWNHEKTKQKFENSKNTKYENFVKSVYGSILYKNWNSKNQLLICLMYVLITLIQQFWEIIKIFKIRTSQYENGIFRNKFSLQLNWQKCRTFSKNVPGDVIKHNHQRRVCTRCIRESRWRSMMIIIFMFIIYPFLSCMKCCLFPDLFQKKTYPFLNDFYWTSCSTHISAHYCWNLF